MNLSYQIQRHLFLISVVYVLSVSVAMADLTASSRVNLEQHLYFKSLNGDPVQVHPGQYMVELKDIWLQLTPVEGERFDAILVETQRNSHEQDISRAEAILVPSTEEVIDIQQLVLYLPNGTAYESTASQTGVWPRGIGGKLRNKFFREASMASRWLKYCSKKQPSLTLSECCAKQRIVCRKRCPNRRFGKICKPDCTKVYRLCANKASARDLKNAQEKYATCKRVRKVVDHNVCCFDQSESCGKTCRLIADTKLQDSCYKQCAGNRESCIKSHSKQQYARLAKKKHNPVWMTNHCSDPKNLEKRTSSECCSKMTNRCLASCEGYPKDKIHACTQRCDTAQTQCFQGVPSQ